MEAKFLKSYGSLLNDTLVVPDKSIPPNVVSALFPYDRYKPTISPVFEGRSALVRAWRVRYYGSSPPADRHQQMRESLKGAMFF
jgi:hypothetical protein